MGILDILECRNGPKSQTTSIFQKLISALTAAPAVFPGSATTRLTGSVILKTANPRCAVRWNIPDHQVSLRLQENRVSWSEEKREPTVRHVRLRESVCACHRRTKTFHNLTQGQSALFRETEQKSR